MKTTLWPNKLGFDVEDHNPAFDVSFASGGNGKTVVALRLRDKPYKHMDFNIPLALLYGDADAVRSCVYLTKMFGLKS